jgi:hypothetical protein
MASSDFLLSGLLVCGRSASVVDIAPRMKRRLLRLLVSRIEVTNEEVRVVYRVSLRPFVNSPLEPKGAFLQHCLKSEPPLQDGKTRKAGVGPAFSWIPP